MSHSDSHGMQSTEWKQSSQHSTPSTYGTDEEMKKTSYWESGTDGNCRYWDKQSSSWKIDGSKSMTKYDAEQEKQKNNQWNSSFENTDWNSRTTQSSPSKPTCPIGKAGDWRSNEWSQPVSPHSRSVYNYEEKKEETEWRSTDWDRKSTSTRSTRSHLTNSARILQEKLDKVRKEKEAKGTSWYR